MWHVRGVLPCEMPLVVASWVTSWRRAAFPGTRPRQAMHAIRERIHDVIPSAEVRVATLPDVSRLAIGWACVEWQAQGWLVVWYVYVKQAYRRAGVATALLMASPAPRVIEPRAMTQAGAGLLRSLEESKRCRIYESST